MRPLRLLTPALLLLLSACPRSGSTVPNGGGGSGSGTDGVDPGAEPELPLWSEIRTGKLANGLTYYVLPHKRPEERAYLWLAVNSGSVQEDEDQLGLAHFVEHMAFNGTKRFAHNEIINYFEQIGMSFGADLNAHTSFDETVYKLTVPTDDPAIVSKGLDILRDWAGDISFDAAEVEAERGVVLEEWRGGLGAWDRISKQQAPVLFPDSRYATRDTIGDPEILKHAPREALIRYYEDWYRPDLMAVIVVGDLDPADAVKQIEAKFADLEAPAKPRARIHGEVPPANGTRVSIVTDPEVPSASVQLVNMFPHRPESTATDHRVIMMTALYHRMLNDRLSELTQRQDAPLLYAGTSTGDQTLEIDAFTRYGAVKDGQLDAAITALITEVRRVEQHGFTATELERAKKGLLRDYNQAAETIELANGFQLVDELTRTFFEHELNIGRVAEAELAEQQVPAITLDDILANAATWGTDANRVVLITGPSSMTVPTEAHVLEVIAAAEKLKVDAWVDAADRPLIAKAPTAGTITKEETLADGSVAWTLSNGAKVVVKETSFESDTILMSAFSPGGTAQATDKQWPSARFGADVTVAGGAGDHTAVQLDRMLSDKVASVGMWIGETEEGLYGQASAIDLETMMQLAWLRMTAPRADANAFEVWKQGTLEYVKNRRVMPDTAFYEDMDKILNKDHARRVPPEVADLAKVDLAQAVAFYKDRFGDATDFTFVFVGNVDPTALRPLVETYLASLPAAGRVEKEKDLGVKRPKGVTKKKFELGKEPKSDVYLTFHADQKWTREDAVDMQILAGVLDMTLREIMREQMSGTYGVGVWGWVDRRPHPERMFSVQFNCAPENVAKLEQAMFDEFARLQKDGIDEVTLDKLRETHARNHEGDQLDNRSWVQWHAEAQRYGEDLATVMDVDFKIARITAKNVKAAAKKFLDKKQYVLGELFPAPAPKTP